MGTQPADMVPASVSGSVDGQRRWFAVFTRSHHEKRVAQYYAERDIEHLLPISRVMRQWSHYRKVTVELPLFPKLSLRPYLTRGTHPRSRGSGRAFSSGTEEHSRPFARHRDRVVAREPETPALRATSVHGGWVEGAYKDRSPGRPGGHRFAYEEPLPGGTNALSDYEELYRRSGRCRP
jgi:hypothetical protein